MMSNSSDFHLTNDQLRAVTRFAVESAQEVLTIFESIHRDDDRPRTAIEAAWLFAHGAPRTNLQRVTAIGAHRAAKEADEEAALYAARAAGDAAAAAYLHPIFKATQVGHILRATACAARSAELRAGTASAAENTLLRAQQRATPQLLYVLRHYPPAPTGQHRVTQLITSLDQRLRLT